MKRENEIESTVNDFDNNTWGQSKDIAPITWGTDWDYFSTADHIIIALCPSPYWRHEISIVTNLYIYELWSLVYIK